MKRWNYDFILQLLRAVAEWQKPMGQKWLKMCVFTGNVVCVLTVCVSARPGLGFSPPPQINAFCRLLVADSYQWAISIHPACLSVASNRADELWCPVLFRNPPEPVCLQPPPLYTHAQTNKDTSSLIPRALKQRLFSLAVSVSCMHTVIEDQQNTQVEEYNFENTQSGLYIDGPFRFNFVAIANI